MSRPNGTTGQGSKAGVMAAGAIALLASAVFLAFPGRSEFAATRSSAGSHSSGAAPEGPSIDIAILSVVCRDDVGPVGAPIEVPTGTETGALPEESLSPEIRAATMKLSDTAVPLESRPREIEDLARCGGPEALRILEAVGEGRIHLSSAAVEAIGRFTNSTTKSEAAAYLQAKFGHPDSQLACAAVRAYARLLGAEAVAGLNEALKNGRVRPDGLQETVCGEVVKTLGDIGSADAGKD